MNDFFLHFIISEKEEDLQKWLYGNQYELFIKKPFKNDDIRLAVHNIFLVDEKHIGLTDLADTISESVLEGFGQYMFAAVSDDPIGNDCLYGDISTSIDLIDPKEKIKVSLILFFPEIVACYIYENIFGERNEDEAGEIVYRTG
jgi:hypothetical protein